MKCQGFRADLTYIRECEEETKVFVQLKRNLCYNSAYPMSNGTILALCEDCIKTVIEVFGKDMIVRYLTKEEYDNKEIIE